MGTNMGLQEIEALVRELSHALDALSLASDFWKRMGQRPSADRIIIVTRRGLDGSGYRILEPGNKAPTADGQNAGAGTREWEKLPVHHGGLFAELLHAGAVRVLGPLDLNQGDPAREQLSGMAALAAVPLFEEGDAQELIVHLRGQGETFAQEELKEMVLLAALVGGAMRGAALAQELRGTKARLEEEYRAATELSDTILEQAVELKHHAENLEQRVRERTEELELAHRDAIYMLAAAAEAKDDNTGEHVRRMQQLSYQLARALGKNKADAEEVGTAAILHDVGKLHVPDAILKKAGALSQEERGIMQEHTIAGERILAERAHFGPARRVARSHHENWDGSGYPDGLSGEAISEEARIVHLADVFDALTHERAYKKAWKLEEALEFIRGQKGKMFDPMMVEALEGMVNKGNGSGH